MLDMQKRDFFISVNNTKTLGENLTIFDDVKNSDNCILYFNDRSYIT